MSGRRGLRKGGRALRARMIRAASLCMLVSWLTMLNGCSRGPDRTDLRNPGGGRAVDAPSSSAGSQMVPHAKVRPPGPSEIAAMRAGAYGLTLRALHGSHRGGSSGGSLTLVAASAMDKSQVTGEVAKDVDETPLFYGWTELDFGRVGAPVCRNPDPASRDPVRPGVIVLARTHLDHQVVLIGTLSSLRDGFLHTDGCGIALHVEGSEADCYRRSWDRWGIAENGSGTFDACPIAHAPSH